MSRQTRRAHNRERQPGRDRIFLLLAIVVALTAGVAALFWMQMPTREVATDASAPG